MEHQPPHNPEDSEPNNPHPEDLGPGEIDLTGAIQQDGALHEVIRDALVEVRAARAAGGGEFELPEWGARAIARALANRRDEPTIGALHHFAVTGRITKEAITSELAEIHDSASDGETEDLAVLLVSYIDQHADNATSTDRPADPPEREFEAHDDPIVAQGLSEHGDAFRAYLTLPDTDPNARGLLARFEDVYIGTYTSISELADELTELPACKEEIRRVAGRWGFEELFTVDSEKLRIIAEAIWDIVELSDKVHVFSK
jgi:hypothetical protein